MCNFQWRSLRFLSKKETCKKSFFSSFFLRWKLPRTRLCNFTKSELLQRYFSRILTENFPWQLSKQLFIRTSFFSEHLFGCFRYFSSTRLPFILSFQFHPSVVLFCLLPSSSSTCVRYMGQRLTSYKKVVLFCYR